MAASTVGIDISKDYLNVHIHELADAFRLTRDEPGLDELVGRREPLTVPSWRWRRPVASKLSSPHASLLLACP